jgi:Iap family predicted aminopeptidase
MNIEINKKKYKIKPASELTVKEYISFFSKLSEKPKQMEIIICYVSAITGLDYKDVTSVSIDSGSIRRLMVYIGEVKPPTSMENIDYFYYKKDAKKIIQKEVNWRSFGVRSMLEDKKTTNQLDLAVYLLAIYLNEKYDNEKIEEIYTDLQDYNAISVFSFVFFFIKKLQSGEKQGQNFLSRLWVKVYTNILKLSGK